MPIAVLGSRFSLSCNNPKGDFVYKWALQFYVRIALGIPVTQMLKVCHICRPVIVWHFSFVSWWFLIIFLLVCSLLLCVGVAVFLNGKRRRNNQQLDRNDVLFCFFFFQHMAINLYKNQNRHKYVKTFCRKLPQFYNDRKQIVIDWSQILGCFSIWRQFLLVGIVFYFIEVNFTCQWRRQKKY